MAEDNNEKENQEKVVKLEIELPEEQVSVHSGQSGGKNDDEEKDQKKDKNEKKGDQKNNEDESIIKQATGYEAGELVRAPVSTPDNVDSPKPARGQIRNLLAGFMLVVLSLIAWPIFGFRVAIAVALVGAGFISVGVLVRI